MMPVVYIEKPNIDFDLTVSLFTETDSKLSFDNYNNNLLF